MARHPTARRVQRTDTTPDDAFVARLLEIIAWAKANATILVAAAAILVVGSAATVYYIGHKRTVSEQAEHELTTVRQTAMSGNRALTIRDLESFLQRYEGTRAADDARLLLAAAYLEEGESEKARTTVAKLASKIKTPLGTQAAFLMAAAYEAEQQPERAEDLYLQIADQAQYEYQKRDALDFAARIRSDRGDASGAAALYQRLVDMTDAGSPENAFFELRLAEMRAKASTGS